MKTIQGLFTTVAFLTLLTSCGQEAGEGGQMVNTVGEVRTSREAFFNQQEVLILNRICSATRVKDAFFDTYYIDKNRSINTEIETKECDSEIVSKTSAPLKLTPHLSRIVYTDASGSSAGEFFTEYESLKTGVISELCQSLERGGQISSVVSVSNSSYMQWYRLAEGEERCLAPNSACLFIELGAREGNGSTFKVQQNERITISIANGRAYGFPVLRERIDNAFCNSDSQHRLLKNSYRY